MTKDEGRKILPRKDEAASSTGQCRFNRFAAPLLILIFLLLAFGLRIYALESQSMWSDEGLSLYRARLAPVDILNGLIIIDGIETRDTNPPLFFLLLHLLRWAAGETIFALRYSGVLTGFLAVPLLYVLGTAAYGRRVGLVAALLMAISPFHVWQSQVLRNYSLLLTLNLASVYGLFRYVLAKPGSPQIRWLNLWLIAGLLGIYTHYFGFLVFAFGLFVLLALALWRQGINTLARQKRTWIFLGIIMLILLPAVIVAFDRFSAGEQVDFHHVGLMQVMTHALSGFAVGIKPSLTHSWWLVMPALILSLAGILSGLWTKRLPTSLLIAYQIVPLALLLLLSIINPLYNGVRHLLIGLPPFIIFVALGAAGTLQADGRMSRHFHSRAGENPLTTIYGQAGKPILRGQDEILSNGKKAWLIWRWLRILLAILVVMIQLGWLKIQFDDPKLIRDDIRGVAEYLNEFAEPDDLIILHDTIIGLTFDYYYDGAAPWQAIPTLGEQDKDSALKALIEAGTRADRIWFLVRPTPRTGFPRRWVWDSAEKQWPRFFSRSYPSMWLSVQLNGYKPDPVVNGLPVDAKPIGTQFDNKIQLNGLQLPSTVKAGEPWWATFYWTQLQQNRQDYVLSLRLLDENGRIWQQIDELLWQEYLDHQWPTGTMLGKDYELTAASGLPPGDYGVWLRLLDNDRRPIPDADGEIDHLVGDIEIETGTRAAQLPDHVSQRARLGEVEFLGYNLPADGIRPGHGIPFELFWRVLKTPAQDYQVRIRLIDPSGTTAAESTNLPTREDYPMSRWQVDELLQSKFQMLMPGNIEIVPHYVQVSLISPDSGEVAASVTLADQLVPDPWPYVAELPSGLKSLDVEIGQPASIALRGHDLTATVINPGDSLDFTLYWQAIMDVPEGYYVFIHVISDDGTIVAQFDGAPVQGFRPTLSWREGEVIADRYVIPMDPQITPGTYQVWAGLYHPGTGERPPVVIDGQMTADNRALLQEITVQQTE